MGRDDGYDSMLVGKTEQMSSQWLKHDVDEEYSVELRLNEELWMTGYIYC